MSFGTAWGRGGGGGGEFPQNTKSKNPSYFHTKQKEFTTKRISFFCLTPCLLITYMRQQLRNKILVLDRPLFKKQQQQQLAKHRINNHRYQYSLPAHYINYKNNLFEIYQQLTVFKHLPAAHYVEEKRESSQF